MDSQKRFASKFAFTKLIKLTIVGCDNGIDWSVFHENRDVKIILKDSHEEIVALDDYKEEVFKFADMIEKFYESSQPKTIPENKIDRNGYLTFWKEWHRRRNEQKLLESNLRFSLEKV